VRHVEESADVVRADGALEPVQQEETRRTRNLRIESKDVDEVVVGRQPALDSRRERRRAPSEFAPEGLRVRAGYPPCGAIRNFARDA